MHERTKDAPVHPFDLNLHIAPICDGREPGPCRGGILNPNRDPPPVVQGKPNTTQHSGTKGNKHVNATKTQHRHALTARAAGSTRPDPTSLETPGPPVPTRHSRAGL